MANVLLRAIRKADIAVLAAEMRTADVAELKAMNGEAVDLEQVLRQAWRQSEQSWAAEQDGQLLGMGGFVRLDDSDIGVPWLLGTHRLDSFPLALTKLALGVLETAYRRYTRLVNYVYAEHLPCHRWLAALGFTLSEDTQAMGPDDQPFYLFEWSCCDV